LAQGVQAKGLHDILLGAEQLMREGKFTSAIQKYGDAEKVAPNNPLLRLGQAQAELGATRYGSAEQHLREAVAANPALLMGKYDLEAFYGRDRLAFIVNDLQTMSKNEPSSARAPLLLAYIAYGQPGQETAAADYLNEAAKREGKPDPLIQEMRKTWTLPSSAAAPESAPSQPAAEPNK
jgi:tetratricopeptide (TPR) repeat protein